MGIVTSTSDLNSAKESGRIVRKVLAELAQFIKPGVTTAEIDALGREIIRSEGAIPSFLNYNGYPAAVCISINREVVHGIPSAERLVHDGDIVGIDVGAFKNGFHGDAADTVMVGNVSPEAESLSVSRTRPENWELKRLFRATVWVTSAMLFRVMLRRTASVWFTSWWVTE